MHKGVIAAGAVLVVFAGVQVTSLLLGDEKGSTAAPVAPTAVPTVVVVPQSPSATPKPSGDASGSPTPDAEASETPTEVTEVIAPQQVLVEELVAAYYTRSWQDASSRAWQKKVLALGDEEMEHGLDHDYGTRPTAEEKAEWRTVIMKPKGSTRVSDVEVLTRSATEGGLAVFDVEFTVEKMTEAPASDWTDVFDDTWRVEYAWDGERWLAHSIQVIS